MTLLKTSLLNAIAVLVKMLAMLGINKILAIYVGPSGYALIGQFQNAVQMITTVASGAVNTGVTKYTAEYYDAPEKRLAIWQTATFIALFNSFICTFVLLMFKERLAIYFLNDVKYANVFVWLALALIALVFNSLLLSILNGKKQISRFVLGNILGSLLSFAVIGFLSWQYQIYGALVALAVYQAAALVATIGVCYGTSWFRFKLLFGGFNPEAGKKLLSFALMTVVSAIAMPFVSILVRHLLIERFGVNSAGHWEAMSRISSAYMLFLTSVLAVYYLPRFSEIKNADVFLKEVKLGLGLLLFLASVASACIYFARDYVVTLLFSEDFKPMIGLFAYQMLGDTIKVCGWLLGYVLLSKAMIKTFILAEVSFSLSFYGLAYFYTQIRGFEGVSLAYFVNYCGYFIALLCALPYILKKMKHESN